MNSEDLAVDKINFLDALVSEYSRSGNLSGALETASGGDYSFGKELKNAIYKYKSGIEPRTAFSRLGELPGMGLIESGLDTGADVLHGLRDLLERLLEEEDNKMKIASNFHNAMTINKLGAAVFFPLFAGISMNIIKFSAALNGGAGIDATKLALIFVAYIVTSNYITSLSDKWYNMPLYGALGLLIFETSSVLTMNLLGG